jgi:2'-hydroxyisoflavone reductase
MTTRRECLQGALAAAAAAACPGTASAGPPRLKLLVLGGTGFLGPHMVEHALSRGHEVTLFNRGVSAASLYGDRVELLRGDRDSRTAPGLDALGGTRRWDAVIDNSGYLPRHVADTAALLRERCDHYLFVSTAAVYDFGGLQRCDESCALQRLADPDSEVETAATYGPLKVECERRLRSIFGDARCTVLRPTYVFGPGDDTDRFTYWIERVSRGGDVLGPTRPDYELQWVDVRDLCPWVVELAESRTTGVFNVAGPDQPIRWRDVLESLRVPGGPATTLHWATPEVLEALDLSLPLAGARRRRRHLVADASRAAGLRYRPLADTVAATRRWWAQQPAARRAAARGWPDPAREARAIAMLSGATAAG